MTSQTCTNGLLRLDLLLRGDDSQTRQSYFFLRTDDRVDVVDVSHVFDRSRSRCLRQRSGCAYLASWFSRRLSTQRFPLRAYATGESLAVTVNGRPVRLADVARRGLRPDLKTCYDAWVDKCVKELVCNGCGSPFASPEKLSWACGRHGPELCHDGCAKATEVFRSKIQEADPEGDVGEVLGYRTALSSILASGARTSNEAARSIVQLSIDVRGLKVEADPPSRPYAAVLRDLQTTLSTSSNCSLSPKYVATPGAFACLPATEGWLCVNAEPAEHSTLQLLYEAIVCYKTHGRHVGKDSLLKEAERYPASRLRVSPPPFLSADGSAPVETWRAVMEKRGGSKDSPRMKSVASVRCSSCETIFRLLTGACGHSYIETCCEDWNRCADCDASWKPSASPDGPSMNYHPEVFPFKKLVRVLSRHGLVCLRGPKELLYNREASRLAGLAQGDWQDR